MTLEEMNKPGTVWTEFLFEYLTDRGWIKEKRYFLGPKEKYQDIDINADARFMEVPGKRKEAILIGEYNGGFPVKNITNPL